MSVIYCEIQPFAAEQSIYTLNENGETVLVGKTPLDYLHKVLPEICYSKDSYNIKLSCKIKPMAEAMVKDIQKEESKLYQENKIVIEVE